MTQGPELKGVGEPPRNDGVQPEPKSTRPAFEWGRLWSSIGTLPKIIAGVGAILGGLGVIYGHLRPVVSPANVTIRATCQNDRILISATNSGGRTARLGLPRFRIRSPDRPNEVLDFRRYLKDPPVGDQVDLSSDGGHSFVYENSLDFFGKSESAGNACHFEVKVPVQGRTEPLSGTCPCTYIER